MAETAEQTLDQTLRRAAEGDARAWRTLVDTYARRVYALLARQCGDRDLAEEITQATFVQVVTHIGRYSERGKFEPWLFRIAMNRLRDEMRRRKRQARPMDMTDARQEDNGGWAAAQDTALSASRQQYNPLEIASRAEQVQRVRDAIATLPEADQQILHLRHTAGLSFAEIAKALKQPMGTVLARGHRALGKLRKLLAPEARPGAELPDEK